jgi:antirestriction protein ArdC
MHATDLFDKVTADLIAAIEAGASGWRMPWHRLTGVPRSVHGRNYRGWNALVLALTAADCEWTSGVWATYRGWQRHDAQVRRGERGTHVVLWKPTERHDTPTDDTDDEAVSVRRGLLARTFTVFAAEQVDGYAIDPPTVIEPADRISAAEAYFTAVGAHVEIGGDRACYVPAADLIRLPALGQFERASDFYATSAHEHTHWTGHTDRLGRDLTGRFSDRAYGAEELVAELGAAFWCAQFGIDQATRHDHAAYLADWLTILATDSRALVAACGHAQRAVDYLNTAAHWTPPTPAVVDDQVEECAA